MESAERVEVSGLTLQLITPVYFVAAKLEAFHGRGGGDHVASHDLEDAMAVIDGREELLSEVRNAPEDVRGYIQDEFGELLRSEDFLNAMPGLVQEDVRLPVLRERLDALASRA